MQERLGAAAGFVWRKGDEPGKGVTRSECEQVLLNHARILATDDGWLARGATEETKAMRKSSRRPAWRSSRS